MSNFDSSQSFGKKIQFLFFNPVEFEAKSDFNHKNSKIKWHSTRASKQYLNDNSPIHGRETAYIFRFSEETFESYFKSLDLTLTS